MPSTIKLSTGASYWLITFTLTCCCANVELKNKNANEKETTLDLGPCLDLELWILAP